MEWTYVIIVFQGGTAPPFSPATKARCHVIRWSIILSSVCRKTCYWIRMRRMAHKSNPRIDQTARVYAERAMKIIFGTNNGDLPRALVTVSSLAERREWQLNGFSLICPTRQTVCTNYFRQSEISITGKFRDTKQYPVPWARTERFKKSTIV